MNSGNRILILALLLALLYALYMYQQHIENNEKLAKIKDNMKSIGYKEYNKSQKSNYKSNYKVNNQYDNITMDNVSQIDLGSLEDVRSYENDSLLGSYGTDDASALLDEPNY